MGLTVLSQNELDHLASTSMTAEEAFSYLNNNMMPRTLAGELEKIMEIKGAKKLLIDKLCEYHPDMSRDSVSKKVRGWISGKYEPSDRETYFEICFALGMDATTANEFLSTSSDSGFHYRSPRELTYYFALKTGMGYREATELFKSLPPVPENVDDTDTYTEAFFNKAYKISNVDEFKAYINNNINKMGINHNTAYRYFMTFLKCLTEPDSDFAEYFDASELSDRRISIEDITSEYLRMNIPADTSKVKYNYIQKMIKRYWPSATSIKNMANRTEDIKRKVLILLYLVTEGIAANVNYDIIDDDLPPEEMFKEHYERLCIMMTDCGFALPDPRNVFDWAALYAIRMSNSEEIRDEMQKLINKIFDLPETDMTDDIDE